MALVNLMFVSPDLSWPAKAGHPGGLSETLTGWPGFRYAQPGHDNMGKKRSSMATVDTNERISFERVTGTIGAWVRGVELSGVQPAATTTRLRHALHELGVLFFEFDHTLSASEFVAFGAVFGEPEETYKLTLGKGDAPYIDSDFVPMKEYRVNCWHADGTALEYPPQAAMLTPIELPEAGGDTMWASMYAAWESLSSHLQNLLEGLEVLHTTQRLPFLKNASTAVHPAVIRDPVTGKKLLFVNSNYSERILGISEKESESLLRILFEHVNTPEFHVRLRWRPGVVAVWEERVTQHRGVADFAGPRKLRRLTFAGERPSA
jgi:taurine dioxygenase